MSSLKRMATKFDEIVANKVIKLSDDMEFEEEDFDFGIKNMDNENFEFEATLKYDVIFNDFIITLTKDKTNEENRRQIGLSETEARNLVNKLPEALAYAKRYENVKKVGKMINIPFELDDMDDPEETVAILFVIENAYNRGEMQIDIRKCLKNLDNDAYTYTKDGVRINGDVAKKLLTQLKIFLSTIDENVKITNDVLEKAYVCLLIKAVVNKHADHGCDGCDDNQPGQEAHRGKGGCLQNWEERVSHFWDEAWDFVTDSDVLTHAEKVLKLIPNVQGPVKSVIESQSLDEKELMQMVLDKTQFEENEIFINCENVPSEY